MSRSYISFIYNRSFNFINHRNKELDKRKVQLKILIFQPYADADAEPPLPLTSAYPSISCHVFQKNIQYRGSGLQFMYFEGVQNFFRRPNRMEHFF